jgi:hypothetical protein
MNKAAKRNMIAWRLRPEGPDGGNYPVQQRYPVSDTEQARSRIKLKYQA